MKYELDLFGVIVPSLLLWSVLAYVLARIVSKLDRARRPVPPHLACSAVRFRDLCLPRRQSGLRFQGVLLMKAPVSLPKALWRGFTMKCPNCGQGHLFGRFLKVVDSCEVCGEDYTPQRADDLPAYLVIAVVGHLVVPALLAVEMAYSPPVWLQLLIWVPVTGLAAFFLLQPVKGTIVGLQWQTGMHGFEAAKRRRDRETRDGAAPLPNLVSKELVS